MKHLSIRRLTKDVGDEDAMELCLFENFRKLDPMLDTVEAR